RRTAAARQWASSSGSTIRGAGRTCSSARGKKDTPPTWCRRGATATSARRTTSAPGTDFRSNQQRVLVLQEPALALDPSAVAAQPPVGGDDAVARHHQRDRILAVGGAHRAYGLRAADAARQLSIRPGGANRDPAQRRPDTLLERGAAEIDGDIVE